MTEQTKQLSGPELSAWLAEHVCKWTRRKRFAGPHLIELRFDRPDRSSVWIEGKTGGATVQTWTPDSDRNDVAEVLAKLPVHKLQLVAARLIEEWPADKFNILNCVAWILTVDPLVVCRAIWSVMNDAK